jgi:peroxiredoxin Q/BCP
VSVDDAQAHQQFRQRESLPFDLLVDPDLRLCRLYDVRVTNLLVFKLIERVTYVIGKDGLIEEAFQRVKPQGHAAAVLCRIGEEPGRDGVQKE